MLVGLLPKLSDTDGDAVLASLLGHLGQPGIDEILAAFDDGESEARPRRDGVTVWSTGAAGPRLLPSPFASRAAYLSWLLSFARAQRVRLDPLCGSAGGAFGDPVVRWHCVLPPLSRDGPLFSLRRHRFTELTLSDFSGAAPLASVVTARRPLLVCGPTGSGKTSLLAALLREPARTERIVIVESLPELPRLGPFCARLAERPPGLEGGGAVPLARLVREALRLRPDRLVVGELRGAETEAWLEALGAGHGGVMATLHAGSAREAAARLRLLARGLPVPEGTVITVAVLERGAPPRVESIDEVVL